LLLHGLTGDRRPADQMSQQDAVNLVHFLLSMISAGYTILTWNGLGFDFDILAEESQMFEECSWLALNHVDMMFHVFCELGYPIALDHAAKAMGLAGKPEGMRGALAPRLWAAGKRQEVLDYVAQDARTTLELAETCEEHGYLRWITRSGNIRTMALRTGWLTVREAMTLPEPDTSWMSDPWPRTKFTSWIINARDKTKASVTLSEDNSDRQPKRWVRPDHDHDRPKARPGDRWHERAGSAALEDTAGEEIPPEQVTKLITFGQMALEQGWYDKAREYFEQALALDASNLEAGVGLMSLGKMGLKERRRDLAREYSERALALDATNLEARADLAKMAETNESNEVHEKHPKRYYAILLIGIIIMSILAFSILQERAPVATPDAIEAFAIRVVDGDTIEVEIEGGSYKVCYIGIDTPELHHPEKPVEYFAQEAYEKNRELVEGKTVFLEKDVSETDRYGRLLRYVYTEDVFVNAYLVQQGYALVSTYPPDVKYQERFVELQREAREARRGLWEPIPASAAPGEVIVDPDCSQYDAPGDDQLNPNEEYICFTNQSDHPVDMTGWSVNRRPDTWYTFPTFILQPEASVRLHSGNEVDTSTDLYWGSNEALWRNIHDSVYLYDADGKLMDEYSW